MSIARYFHRNIVKFFDTSGNVNHNIASENDCEVTSNNGSHQKRSGSVKIEVPQQNFLLESLCGDNVTQHIIEICEDISDAIKLFDSTYFENVLKETKSISLIKFENLDLGTRLSSNEVQSLSSHCCNKSILLFFGSKTKDNYLIYWKSRDIDNFLFLKPYCSSKMIGNRILYEFVVNFLINSLRHDHLGLRNEIENKHEITEFELHLLADCHEYNILLTAAQIGDATVVEILLQLGIQTESPFKDINAQSLAFDGHHMDVLLLLLQSNLVHPSNMDMNICSPDVQKFMSMCFDIHHYIEVGDAEKVTEIVDENPNIRHFYNEFNESAASFALRVKQLNIYEKLMMKEVYFGPHENTREIMEDLDYDTQRAVRELHNKHAKDLPESHINLLMANSFVGHDVDNVHEKLSLVQHSFNILNSYPLIRIILMVVAASKKFRIIFDFNRDNVHVADPTASPNTAGIFYVSGRIYIGARQLLNKMTENETFGTLAHELCHYALNLTYGNDANPYYDNDHESMQEFEEISMKCQQRKGKEELVDLVYSHYEHDMQHAELAVRVSHLYGLYHEQPEKLRESKENFKELFDYVENKVSPDMKEAISSIEEKVDKEIELKNKKISTLRRNFYISIVLGMIIAIAIAFSVGFIFYNPDYVFKTMSPKNQQKVENSKVTFKNVSLNFNDLFPSNSLAYDRLTSNHISQLLSGKDLNLDDSEMHYLSSIIDFSWHNMAPNLKQIILSSEMNFQGEIIKIRYLDERIPKAFESISTQQIIQILSSEMLVVGKKLESSVNFYIDRKFIPEDAKLIDFDYKFGYDYIHNYLTIDELTLNRTMNLTLEEFTNKFLNQSFEAQCMIFDQVLSNIYFKSIIIDPIKDEYKFLHKTSDELIEKSEKDKIVILSSEAGAGKTVTFQQLAIKIKEIFPTRWVSFIDLKDYTKFYTRNEIVENVESLLENIFNLNFDKNEFEWQVFVESFRIGNVILLWNGFDEISPAYNNFIINVIERIYKNTKNIQFVCTRPLYSKQLRDTLKVRTWELIPFTKAERREFLTEFFSFQNLSKHVIDEFIEKVSKVVQQFESHDKISYNFSTPMMLKLVGEIYENRNSLDTPGLYEIYETFVQKKIIIWLTKSTLEYSLLGKFITKFSVVDIYLKYALLVELRVFQTTTFALKTKKLQIMQKTIPNDLPFEEISRMGILYINGDTKFEFAHRTFTEFFIAKYFIDNVYLADNYVDDQEAELRLEIFFLYAKNYGEVQTPITDFMDSYFQNKKLQKDETFSIKFAKLLRTKFHSFLFRLLDTNSPKIFDFLFKFFSKDHNLLLDLLHIYESETFYTAIYNPNYIALFTDPGEIKTIAKKYLSENEIEMFTNGTSQKGNILFGMQFYKLLNVSKQHDSYDFELEGLNSTSYWDSIDNVLINLTVDEQKELATNILSPKIYIYYSKLLKVTNFTTEYTNPNYEQLWHYFKTILSQVDLEKILENSINSYFELFAYDEPESSYYLRFLAQKIEENLSDFQIFDFYLRTNILQKAHWNPSDFINLWTIISDHTSLDEKKQALLIDYADDRNFYFFSSLNESKEIYSNKLYVYLYYDFTPFNILHRAISTPYALTFDYIKDIYQQMFNDSEIQQIIMSSNDLIYYAIEQLLEENFEKFVIYLKDVFKNNPLLLRTYLERHIEPTKLSIFSFVQSFDELAASEQRWFTNLKTLKNLYDEVKEIF